MRISVLDSHASGTPSGGASISPGDVIEIEIEIEIEGVGVLTNPVVDESEGRAP